LKKIIYTAMSLLLAAALLSCDRLREEVVFAGSTMGTTYQVKIVTGYFSGPKGLQQKIDARLEQINQSMSTYRPDSEISRFNKLTTTGEKFAVSGDFLEVMRTARRIFELSGGAWDATIDPLVQLWGFGRSPKTPGIPEKDELQRQRKRVGFDFIRIFEEGALLKTRPDVTLDLGSIAKGFGVDQVAALLLAEGFTDFLVEIGGEVFAAGSRIDGMPWRIGINHPSKDAPVSKIYRVAELSNRALATSGDYRNFVEIDGRLYAHVIDPQTGYPVENGVVSVSVVADSCTLADGLATAVMVMGHEKGLALVQRLQGVECLIVVQASDGTLTDVASRGFPPDIFYQKPS
jgi:thiamine biosynthesis lipoprotein